jgi:uncharacterized membrane protein
MWTSAICANISMSMPNRPRRKSCEHMPWMSGPLVMLFFMVLCIGMLVLMMRGPHGGRSSHPWDVLNERVARGEIIQAEYEDRRKVLEA